MTKDASLLETGRIARVRQRTYRNEDVIPPRRTADSTLVQLSCVDADNQGQRLEVIWERELDPTILTSVENQGDTALLRNVNRAIALEQKDF